MEEGGVGLRSSSEGAGSPTGGEMRSAEYQELYILFIKAAEIARTDPRAPRARACVR